MGFVGVLGHEFVGRVVKLHDDADEQVKSEWMGQRVCGDINLGCCNDVTRTEVCGVCDDSLGYEQDGGCCQMSRNHCPNRTVLGILNQDGTFAGEFQSSYWRVASIKIVYCYLNNKMTSYTFHTFIQNTCYYPSPICTRYPIRSPTKLPSSPNH
jgi:threonine dehydrogenase-like Zn-dependent dehydrogenase